MDHDVSLSEILSKAQEAMEKRRLSFEKLLSRTRTGKATVSLLDGLMVPYYGAPTPLNQVASLAIPDPRTLVVSPFEKSLIKDIEKAILVANLGLQPSSDGQVVRIAVPPLTKDRRQEIARSLRKSTEEAKVGVRSVRQNANNQIKKLEKEKEISQDESKVWQSKVQDLTDEFNEKIQDMCDTKEQEILQI